MPANSIIPDWLFVADASGQLRAKTSAEFQRLSKPQSLQAPGIAEEAFIPIVYGGPERLGGMPYTVGTAAGGADLLVSYILCEGPIERVAAIEINDAPAPAGVTLTVYTGTDTQGIDPQLAAAIPGFDEAMPGTAYIVARFPTGVVQGIPRLTAEIYGRLVVDRSQKGVSYLPAPANAYAVMANSAQSNINGATLIDVSFVGALAQWVVSPNAQVFVSKWQQSIPRQVLSFQVAAAGQFRLFIANDGGTVPNLQFDSPGPIPLAPGQFGGVRVVANLAANGFRTAQFYYTTDGVTWLPLGGLVSVAYNLLPAAAFSGAPWSDTGGASAVALNGTLAGLPAYSITDSNAAGYTGRGAASAIPAIGATYACGFRVRKTVGAAPLFGLNVVFGGGTGKTCTVRINTTTGTMANVNASGVTIDAGDHWEFRGSVVSNPDNTTVSYFVYPAVTGAATEVGTATVGDMWLSCAMFETGVMPWQVSSRSQGGEVFPAVGAVYSAAVKWDGVEHVRFNPEDAADGATTWPAPTGEVWTVAGGPTVATRPAFASDNPAIILDDFMRTFGRRNVSAASVRTARDHCNAQVGGERRARLTITLKEARNVDEWIEVLRGYIPAWVVFKESYWHIIPDTVSAPVYDYNADTDNRTDGEAPMALFKRGAREVPNVVEVVYTETGVKPWTDKRAVATLPGLGTGQRRKATVSLPGIRSYAQAYRFAVERLNHYTVESIEGEVAVMDDGIAILPGDIVTITDAAHGWAAKQVRVLRADERDNGRWSLRFREFNPLAYSTDAPVSPPPPSSGTLPNPINVGVITALTAAETLKYENAAINTSDALARGLIWQSRIEASWAASGDPYLDYYEVRIKGATLAQPSVTTSKLPQFCSAPLIQGTTYQVDVRIVNSLGFAGEWVSIAVPVLGKQLPPSDVAPLEQAIEIGGEVILRWPPVPDVDVVRYEWKYLYTAATSAAWDSMITIDRPDTNYTRIKGLSPGPVLLAIKAIDSVGRYSVNPRFVSVTVVSDAGNFLQTFEYVLPVHAQLTRTDTVPLIEGTVRPLPRWVTKGAVIWNTAMPNPVASLNTPVVAAFGRNASFALACNTWDFGLALEATVELNLSWFKALRGTVTIYLAYSLDGTTYTYDKSWNAVAGAASLGRVNAKVLARFARVEIYSNAVTDAFMQEGTIAASVSSTTRSESGNGTSLASGATRVNLAQKYTKAVSISITPNGTTFATGSYNNVIVGVAVTPNSFDVYLFNSSGVQISQPFSWTFRGV